MNTSCATGTSAAASAERAAHRPDGDKNPRAVLPPRKISARIKVLLTSFKNII